VASTTASAFGAPAVGTTRAAPGFAAATCAALLPLARGDADLVAGAGELLDERRAHVAGADDGDSS
jgi:hypothetical protein